MNSLTRLLLTSALLVSAAFAAPTESSESSYSASADFTYATLYTFRSLESAGASFQPSIKAAAGDAYIAVFANEPVNRRADNEVDYTLGWTHSLGGSVSVDVGATIYDYPTLHDRTNEAFIGATSEQGGFTTGLYLYRDLDLKTTTVQGTFGYSLPLGEHASIDLLGTVGRTRSIYTYYGAGVTIPYHLGSHVTITGGTQYADHNLNGAAGKLVWFTVGVTVAY